MTELTSTPLANAIVWSFDHREKVLDETFKLFSGNINLIRGKGSPELKPSIFDGLREANVELIGSGRGASMVELFESCD